MKTRQEVDINIKIDLANLNSTVTKLRSENSSTSIETSMSVSQLAYLCKLLYDTGYLTNKNKTEILSAVSQNFVTNHASEISLKSLKAKFYTIDPSTKESTKEILLNLLNNIN